eukprot:4613335-Prymnesium_polylepis.2
MIPSDSPCAAQVREVCQGLCGPRGCPLGRAQVECVSGGKSSPEFATPTRPRVPCREVCDEARAEARGFRGRRKVCVTRVLLDEHRP